ncbi:NAD+ synthetase [Batrachochytrium salamandrivorans]|nr:NAD+ synthetase [Batrachochytrium salamandrivorans]
MPAYITLATCSLNQWALDFSGNYARIQESITLAKTAGACYRLGPELEITGYGCNDHFLEGDTHQHSWEVLQKLLADPRNQDITCDVGMPIMLRGVLYNCRVIFRNMRILLIRPKMFLANDGNYREMRWFTPWTEYKRLDEIRLPEIISSVDGQRVAPFGDGVVAFPDAVFGTESCEELFTPHSPHVQMSLDDVDVFTNGSASHHEFQKLNWRVQLIQNATGKCGGIYLYSNLKGCDGERVYYDGCPLIVINGEVVAQGSQFSLADVEVITATLDIQDVRSYRAGLVSRSLQAVSNKEHYPVVAADGLVTSKSMPHGNVLAQATPVAYHSPSEEIRLDEIITRDLEAIIGYPLNDSEMTPSKICGDETRARALQLAQRIGSYHLSVSIDTGVDAILGIFQAATLTIPKFRVYGGSVRENIALQNIQSMHIMAQARLRMVISYLFAQLLPWTRDRRASLLVLGSANVDEMLRGYLTKYDCSSADINPLGGISKVDLVEFVRHMSCAIPEFGILTEFLDAPPTAELEPITASHQQTDEEDMGMSYKDLSVFGTLKDIQDGPSINIAARVKRMFYFYSINRHKATVMPPAYHMSSYSADDNRFDLRPFLYNAAWTWQFGKIDEYAEQAENSPVTN